MTKTSVSASISVKDAEIAKIVLMPGDPLRAKHVAERYLENPVCFMPPSCTPSLTWTPSSELVPPAAWWTRCICGTW